MASARIPRSSHADTDTDANTDRDRAWELNKYPWSYFARVQDPWTRFLSSRASTSSLSTGSMPSPQAKWRRTRLTFSWTLQHLIDSFKALGTDLGTVQRLVQHLFRRSKFYEHHHSDTESDATNQGDDGSLRFVAWQCHGGTSSCVPNHHPVMMHKVGCTACPTSASSLSATP